MTTAKTIRAEGTLKAGLSVRMLGSDAEFDAVRAAWDAVLERSEATVFQTWEWQRTWWKYLGKGKRLMILLFERDGSPEGIAPLFLEKERRLGLPVAAWLRFIGVGISDYLSVLAVKGKEEEVLEALAGWLSDHRRGWDVFDLEDVPETSPSFRLLPPLLESRGLRVYRYQGNVCPRIPLPPDEQGLMQQLGASRSYNLKRKQKRLRQHFRHEVRTVSKPVDPIEDAIEQFAVIHGGRWKSQGHPSAFDHPLHRAFHTEVCRMLAGRGWLRIFFLDVEDQPTAVSFSFNFRSTIYMYQSNAHGPHEVMRCSPGMLVRAIAMSEGIREGMRVFDFMRGNETYKYSEWGATDVNNWLIRSSSPTAAGIVRFYLFLWSEFGRKAVDRMRMEYYDYRRYKLSGQSEEVPVPVYAMEKAGRLLSVTGHFILRHLPAAGRKSSGGKERTGA